MATAATIDRIVHHSVILEFDLPGYWTSEAQERQLHWTPSGQNNNVDQVLSPRELFSVCAGQDTKRQRRVRPAKSR